MAELKPEANITQHFMKMDLNQENSKSKLDRNQLHNTSKKISDNTHTEDEVPASSVETRLEEHGIFRKKKKSRRFPNAKYYCRICDYHCDTLEVCFKHVKNSRHQENSMWMLIDLSLEKFPKPTVDHFDAMTDLIENVAKQNVLQPSDLRDRQIICQEFEEKLQKMVPGMSVVIIGSTLSGFALKDSDLDLALNAPEGVKVTSSFRAAIKLVNEDRQYSDLETKLVAAYPHMQFVHCPTNTKINVGIYRRASHQTAVLMSHYHKMDSRVPALGTAMRVWAKICKIDIEEFGFFPAHSFPLMVIHFLQHSNPPVLPCLHEVSANLDSNTCPSPEDLPHSWKSQNTQSVGELWLEMFRFYAVSFPMSKYVINIRFYPSVARSDRGPNRKIFIEDPMNPKKNLTGATKNRAIYDYIIDVLKISYRYFAVPQVSYGKKYQFVEDAAYLHSKLCSRPEREEKPLAEDEDDENDIKDSEVETEEKDQANKEKSKDKSVPLDWLTLNSWPDDEMNRDLSSEELSLLSAPITQSLISVSPRLASQLGKCHKSELNYRFEQSNFIEGLTIPVQCYNCHELGHIGATCKIYQLPELVSLPALQREYVQLLSNELGNIVEFYKPTSQCIVKRRKIVENLEESLREILPSAVLHLFGSSANGFGFRRSDLDICMMFENVENLKVQEQTKIIEKIATHLTKLEGCSNVLAITSARVPIVKLYHRTSNLEVDISLYNILAMRNTKLLNMYADLDPRVRDLGYAMKYLAKECDIGDASRGSLSSYAYILMVIHYLQQCNPPVVPVLQELYDPAGGTPEILHDGWNSWFFCDKDGLANVWSGMNQNHQSLGELWVGLFRYFTEVFDWENNIITIRQFEPLSRLEKAWNTKCIAIEDPFVLSHNLGAGLGRKMSNHILKCFIHARETFGAGQLLGAVSPTTISKLFRRSMLTDGVPPNDRGCRICGKIGHMVRECPWRKGQRRKNRQLAPEAQRYPEPKIVKEKGILSVVITSDRFLQDFVDNPLYRLLFVAIGYYFCSAEDLEREKIPEDSVVYCFPCRCDGHESLYLIKLPSPESAEEVHVKSPDVIESMVEMVSSFKLWKDHCHAVPEDNGSSLVQKESFKDVEQEKPKLQAKMKKKSTPSKEVENKQKSTVENSSEVSLKTPTEAAVNRSKKGQPVKSSLGKESCDQGNPKLLEKRSMAPKGAKNKLKSTVENSSEENLKNLSQAATDPPKIQSFRSPKVVIVDNTVSVQTKKKTKGKKSKGFVPPTEAALNRLAKVKRAGVDLEFLENNTLDPEVKNLIKLDKQVKKAKAKEAKKLKPSLPVIRVKSSTTKKKKTNSTSDERKAQDKVPLNPKRTRIVANLFQDLNT